MEKIRLSWLSVTGALNSKTPFCVLKEFCLKQKIPLEEKKYSEKEVDEILHKIEKNSYFRSNNLSEFFNPTRRFSEEEIPLLRKKFFQWTKSFEIPSKIFFSYLTFEDSEGIDCCFLYRLCRKNQIETFRSTTFDQMKFLLENFRENSKKTLLQMTLAERISKMNLSEILSLCSFLGIQNYPQYVRKELPKFLSQNRIFFETIENPKNHSEAVFFVGLHFSIDISESSSPLEEYLYLQEVKRENYEPRDSEFLENWRRNPSLYDLKKTFSPLFPEFFYSNRFLKNFYNKIFGFKIDGGIDFYEFLSENLRKENFYSLDECRSWSKETPIFLNSFSETEKENFFAFGNWGDKMVLCSFDEFLYTLSVKFNLNNFLRSSYSPGSFFENSNSNEFSDISLQKLSALCLKAKTPDSLNLKEKIEEILKFQKSLNQRTNKISKKYFEAGEIFQNQFQNCLRSVLHLSMYMRGWIGKGPYPLKSIETVTDDQRFNLISIKITEIFNEIQAQLHSEIGRCFFSLPLMKFSSGNFSLFLDVHSIEEKLNIIRNPSEREDFEAVKSCIRTSSNLLLSTVSYYSKLFGIPEEFKITDLEEIA